MEHHHVIGNAARERASNEKQIPVPAERRILGKHAADEAAHVILVHRCKAAALVLEPDAKPFGVSPLLRQVGKSIAVQIRHEESLDGIECACRRQPERLAVELESAPAMKDADVIARARDDIPPNPSRSQSTPKPGESWKRAAMASAVSANLPPGLPRRTGKPGAPSMARSVLPSPSRSDSESVPLVTSARCAISSGPPEPGLAMTTIEASTFPVMMIPRISMSPSAS